MERSKLSASGSGSNDAPRPPPSPSSVIISWNFFLRSLKRYAQICLLLLLMIPSEGRVMLIVALQSSTLLLLALASQDYPLRKHWSQRARRCW